MVRRLMKKFARSHAIDVDQIRSEGALDPDDFFSYLDYVIDADRCCSILKSETFDWNPSVLYIIRWRSLCLGRNYHEFMAALPQGG
jgi:hypothetical protein